MSDPSKASEHRGRYGGAVQVRAAQATTAYRSPPGCDGFTSAHLLLRLGPFRLTLIVQRRDTAAALPHID